MFLKKFCIYVCGAALYISNNIFSLLVDPLAYIIF